MLTDYGLTDEFAGVLRAVVAREAPGASIVDVSHDVAPFDVRAGALALVRAAPHLGPGVIVGVVDPGVGGPRRCIAIETPGRDAPRYLVGPDNGLLMWAAEAIGGIERVVEIDRRRRSEEAVGRTFDGRDVFAPAAAALYGGSDLSALGRSVEEDGLTVLEAVHLEVWASGIEAEVLWIDRFGNAELSATPGDAERAGLGAESELVVTSAPGCAEERIVTRAEAFCGIPDGSVGVIVDSNGHVALAGNRLSAALTLGLRAGDRVRLVRVDVPGRERGGS